jgi:hypothetical protein
VSDIDQGLAVQENLKDLGLHAEAQARNSIAGVFSRAPFLFTELILRGKNATRKIFLS